MIRAGRRAKRCHYGSGTVNMVKKPVKKTQPKKAQSFKRKILAKLLVLRAKWNSLVARVKLFAVKLRGY